MKGNDWSFDSELIFLVAKMEIKIKEVPVAWQDKKSTSKVRPIRDGIRSFIGLVNIRLASR